MKITALMISLIAIPNFAFGQDHVYVATNNASGNSIALFNADKTNFAKVAEFNTGGLGTGDLEIPALKKDPTHPLANGDDPLISAYGIRATANGKYLLAVNAGDSSISLMSVAKNGYLTFQSKAASSDRFPISVAVAGNKVVVASVGNTNGEGSISAYMIKDNKLMSIANSKRDLKARPSSIAFSSDGDYVIVTELVSGKIKSFAFSDQTLSNEPVSTVDSPRSEKRFQAIPVGFDIAPNKKGDIVLVSEARFLTPDFKLREAANVVPQSPKYSWQTSSVSSYQLDKNGQLTMVSGDVYTGTTMEGGEIANCWVEFNADNTMLWAANALSSSISTFAIDKQGKTTLKMQTAYKQPKQMQFYSDLKLSKNSGYLYQLVGNQGQVIQFNSDAAALSVKATAAGLPVLGAYGLEVISMH